MLIDIRPLLKYRDFRLLYLGQFISWFGSMLTYVALPYQVYHLTYSSLAVGYVGIIELVPLLITSLWGGALADKLDRRKLLLAAEVGLILTSSLLFVNSMLLKPHLWVVYLVAGIASALDGFHRPSSDALTQILVKKDDMPAVAALQQFRFGVSMIVGPTLAGFILAKWGLAIVYCVDFLSYFGSLMALIAIKTRFVPEKNPEPILRSIKEGIRYAMSRQELIGTYVIDFVAMVFGMPMALFPAIAHQYKSTVVLGWLYAAPSIGLLFASTLSSWVDKIHRHGVAISASATVWGLAIMAFGLVGNIYFAIFFLAIAGAADSISGLFRSTMWNQTIPTHLRGRLASIEMISYMSGPLLGNAEAGIMAAGFGVTFSVVSGGVLCVLSVIVLTLLLPRFWKYSTAR